VFGGSIANMKTKAKKAKPVKPYIGPKTFDEYVARLPEPSVQALEKMREAIRSVVPADCTEIIRYRIPAFKHKRVLVWYGAFANHLSLFPTAAVLDAFKDELKDFSTSKGTVQFPTDKPLPIALIKKLVKARVTLAETKKKRR
jgi:uncharacterized protein YdhG (YjbR/CyaY superfamily)